MLCFDSEVDLQNWLEMTKDYFKVSNLTFRKQKLNFYLVETHALTVKYFY